MWVIWARRAKEKLKLICFLFNLCISCTVVAEFLDQVLFLLLGNLFLLFWKCLLWLIEKIVYMKIWKKYDILILLYSHIVPFTYILDLIGIWLGNTVVLDNYCEFSYQQIILLNSIALLIFNLGRYSIKTHWFFSITHHQLDNVYILWIVILDRTAFNSPNHQHSAGFICSKFVKLKINLTQYKFWISVWGPTLWNEILSNPEKELTNLFLFNNRAK